jgi:hypothetical protein
MLFLEQEGLTCLHPSRARALDVFFFEYPASGSTTEGQNRGHIISQTDLITSGVICPVTSRHSHFGLQEKNSNINSTAI